MITQTIHEEGLTLTRTGDTLRVNVVKRDATDIRLTMDSLTEVLLTWNDPHAHFIIDRQVFSVYQLAEILDPATYTLFDATEHTKTLGSVSTLADTLYAKGVHRRATLVGVGGGVTTDTVGLLATLYFRGVQVAYVPTSLLAMIDAAIGGKVGVNHPRQKNLLGHFYHPATIVIPVTTLDTLPQDELIAAFGEVLKIALVDSVPLFEMLEGIADVTAVSHGTYQDIIRLCVERKLELLGANCFERQLDRILNFGHTVAHPIEDITQFRIKHGAAVGMGIAAASHIAAQRGVLSGDDFTRILNVMRHLHMPLMDRTFDFEALWEHVSHLVMQRGGTSLYYVIPVRIGAAQIIDSISKDELKRAVMELRELA